MLDTLVVLWLAGTFCMTLDYLRQYRMAVSTVKSTMSYSIYLLGLTADKDTVTLYKQTLTLGFDKQHSYVYSLTIALITMSILWPLALYALIFRQNSYERRMQSIMLAKFNIVMGIASYTILNILKDENSLVEGEEPSQEDFDERIHRD
jgi:hypothetical protein